METAKITLWNLETVPGWKLECWLEQAYYQRQEQAAQLIRAELARRQEAK